MSTLRGATYVGPVDRLCGKTALVRSHPERRDLLLAQFDDPTLEHNGAVLGYGWHEFNPTSFNLHLPDDPEETRT